MGVYTTADEKRDAMREAVKAADEAIAAFVLDVCVRGECWGANEYSDEYKLEMRKALTRMHEIREIVG